MVFRAVWKTWPSGLSNDKTSAFVVGFWAMFFSWEIMIKSNNSSSWRTFCFSDLGNGPYVVFHYMAFLINWQWIKWICSILVSVAKLGPPYQCLKQNVAWQQISQHVNDPRTSTIWCQLISHQIMIISRKRHVHIYHGIPYKLARLQAFRILLTLEQFVFSLLWFLQILSLPLLKEIELEALVDTCMQEGHNWHLAIWVFLYTVKYLI